MNHIKEVIDTLDKIVREEDIEQVVVAGAEVAMPILREQLPKHLADKILEIGPHEDGESGSFVADGRWRRCVRRTLKPTSRKSRS